MPRRAFPLRKGIFATAVITATALALVAGANGPANDFSAPPLRQARSLLRRVRPYGRLAAERPLPRRLEQLVEGRQRLPRAERLSAFLRRSGIEPATIGGSLETPIPKARYFVIHDTSYPYYGDEELPDRKTLESAEWKGNNLAMWSRVRVTHVYVTRTGESLAIQDFARPMRATKYERGDPARRAGLFLHVELVQPRKRDPKGGPKNDALAPEPGFTPAQLERLALLYVAASVRSGQWLIPAFHAAVDAGIPDAHDDPQNFDLARWSGAVQKVLDRLD